MLTTELTKGTVVKFSMGGPAVVESIEELPEPVVYAPKDPFARPFTHRLMLGDLDGRFPSREVFSSANSFWRV